MRNFTVEGKNTILITLEISKVIHLVSVKVLLYSAVTHLNKIHNEFTWNHKKPKIKEKTLINDLEKGGLKNKR